ncbi:MAG: hypothetical protein Q9212_005253 [Teloschistes hypoglaucus]
MPTPTATSLPRHCTPVRLPSGGLLAIGDGNMITLTQEAMFQPLCTSIPGSNVTLPDFDAATFDDKDPFYASTLPQMYAIAAVTVVSYLLVIIIFITPRTFLVGGSGGGASFLGSRGMISGASGSTSVIGVGGRPWLQKVAALTVAISLTIASVDVFREAERQYDGDFSDAVALTNEVVNSLELRIVRVISETVLWLAQAQTLIRLFPRHKEKVIIKWAGFVLIALDTIFSILNSFVTGSAKNAPRRYQDAVPALNYLFTFSLSLIYAAWITYYSLSKRRYAFLHPKMRNICLVALLSYVAILIPVVFFILDISIYNVAGWGNYVRWVGAAAASVVVWEWVERIEALERDERKDGILGREIFDGDEMLNVTPSSAVTWANSRRFGGGSGVEQKTITTGHKGLSSFVHRLRGKRRMSRQDPDRPWRRPSLQQVDEYMMSGAGRQISDESSPPGGALTTASTTKAVGASGLERSISQSNYHPVIVPPPAHTSSDSSSSQTSGKSSIPEPQRQKPTLTSSVAKTMREIALKVPIPFLHRHMSPPIEVKKAVAVQPNRQQQHSQASRTPPPHPSSPHSAISEEEEEEEEDESRPRTPRVAAPPTFLERFGLGTRNAKPAAKKALPVTVVPAPRRNPTSWAEVRLSGGSIPTSSSWPLSQIAVGHARQLSRGSTPVVPSPRYSPAPFRQQRMSRSMMGTPPAESPAPSQQQQSISRGMMGTPPIDSLPPPQQQQQRTSRATTAPPPDDLPVSSPQQQRRGSKSGMNPDIHPPTPPPPLPPPPTMPPPALQTFPPGVGATTMSKEGLASPSQDAIGASDTGHDGMAGETRDFATSPAAPPTTTTMTPQISSGVAEVDLTASAPQPGFGAATKIDGDVTTTQEDPATSPPFPSPSTSHPSAKG